jgi:hypothetical protein
MTDCLSHSLGISFFVRQIHTARLLHHVVKLGCVEKPLDTIPVATRSEPTPGWRRPTGKRIKGAPLSLQDHITS